MSFPGKKVVQKTWYALDVELEVEACEAVAYGLMEAGSLGTETNTSDERFTRITGYFDQPPDVEELRNKLFEALRIYDLRESSLREINLREIEDRDWLAEWKKDWQPVQVGRLSSRRRGSSQYRLRQRVGRVRRPSSFTSTPA